MTEMAKIIGILINAFSGGIGEGIFI